MKKQNIIRKKANSATVLKDYLIPFVIYNNIDLIFSVTV